MFNWFFRASVRKKIVPVALVSAALLSGCFSGPKRPQPVELASVTPLVAVPQSWTSRVGPVSFPLAATAIDSTVAVASDDGTVALLDARTGRDIWRAALGSSISAGVGSDGTTAAVVTRGNELVALRDGRELWRQKLGAEVFTSPFVAGARVFVLAADRSVSAFDGQTGRKLWVQQRPNEPLVLKQSGVLLAVGDTLVVGLSGRLVGLNPLNGSVRWEVPIASPRGINDVERLVDLVGGVSRQADVVCVRAFQASIGCVNATRGTLLWSKPANGSQGIQGDSRLVYGVETDGVVLALRNSDGERAWSTDRLRYRLLTAPVVAGRSVVVGDTTGFLHFLSREDGSLLNRLSTDGSAIAANPVMVNQTLVAVTRNGGVFGFLPE
ncbi:MAG: outer membrane protein assembly factor BamB [Polaromonas sp.]|nr:outer membrane protein assembly factor BamB [Polaromonas sp.]